ncbi:MAG: Uma2 family endonuclease, partial [Aggregatilineales bacterium]
GASFRHNLIAANAHFALCSALSGRSCFILQSDLRVALSNTFVYPDVVVICGQPQLIEQDTLLNSTAIVEVLSPSAEAHARGIKWQRYQQLESLQDYLLIAQNAPKVAHLTRQNAHQWLSTIYEGLDAVLSLPKLNANLPLSAFYTNVTFGESE